jgi:hypothetical protein
MDLQQKIPINIEPGFFEWMRWVRTLPVWIDDPVNFFNINKNYKANISRNDLQRRQQETIEDYFTRSSSTLRQIIESTGTD